MRNTPSVPLETKDAVRKDNIKSKPTWKDIVLRGIQSYEQDDVGYYYSTACKLMDAMGEESQSSRAMDAFFSEISNYMRYFSLTVKNGPYTEKTSRKFLIEAMEQFTHEYRNFESQGLLQEIYENDSKDALDFYKMVGK